MRDGLVSPPVAVLILAALKGEASYGYDLVKRLNQASGDRFNFREGTLYPVLHRLEKGKLVKAKWEPTPKGQKGPRRRRVYALTGEGRSALSTGMKELQGISVLAGKLSK